MYEIPWASALTISILSDVTCKVVASQSQFRTILHTGNNKKD